MKDIKEAINPYRYFLNKVKEGKINPIDVRIDLLVEEFKIKAYLLEKNKLYRQASLFIQAIGKLLKLKTDKALIDLFPDDNNNRQKRKGAITVEDVKEALEEFNVETIDDVLEKFGLETLLNYNPYSIGGKSGGKGRKNNIKVNVKPYNLLSKDNNLNDNFKDILFENTNYNEYAKEIKKKIDEGNFKIKSIKDFIGLMFAINIYSIEIDDISRFL